MASDEELRMYYEVQRWKLRNMIVDLVFIQLIPVHSFFFYRNFFLGQSITLIKGYLREIKV